MEKMKDGCFFRLERVCEPPIRPKFDRGRIDATVTLTIGNTAEKWEKTFTTRFMSI